MSSGQQKEQAVVTLPVENDYAVQPIENEGIVPVDGPIIEVSVLSFDSLSSLSEAESSEVSEQLTLASSFHSPRSAIDEGASVTSFEEGEMVKAKLESSDEVKFDVVNALEKVIEIEIKKDGDEPEAKNETKAATIDEGLPVIVDGGIQGGEDAHGAPQAGVISSTINAKPTEDVIVEDHKEQSTVTKATQEVVPPVKSAGLKGEDAVVESSKPVPGSHCVPPHLRPKVQPAESGRSVLETSKYSKVTSDGPRYDLNAPRAPRAFPPPFNSSRYNDNGGTINRLQAHILKIENDLNEERTKNAKFRQTLEFGHQKETDAALSSMTIELVRKQGKAIAQQAKFEAMHRNLQIRAKVIEQLEYYLSEGQKYLNQTYEADDSDRRALYDFNRREHEFHMDRLRREKMLADREGDVSMRAQAIHDRESAQMMREQQFVAINRKTIEAELRETMVFDMEDKLVKVADTEYNSGFGAGKEAGRKEAEEEARQNGFLEGYGACHHTQVTLRNMQAGRIPHDSPELAFLLDPAHPHNAFTIGTRIGRFEGEKQFKVQKKKPFVVRKMEAMVEQKKEEEAAAQKEESVPVQPKFTQSYVAEEIRQGPVRRMPAPRPTFASEFRTNVPAMHNGAYVLANNAGSPSAAAAPKVNGGANFGEDVYAGRRIVKYEDSDEGNLIDLY